MTEVINEIFARVFRQLESKGLLLVSGTEITDVRGLVSKSRTTGSWWKDPSAHTIFAINEMLEAHPDVVITKLVAGKVTFIHRSLWDQLYAVATSRAEWQMEDLSSGALTLLKKLDKDLIAQSDQLTGAFGDKHSNITRELESRLLIYTRQFHTESGKHAKQLQSWKYWATTAQFRPRALGAIKAMHSLEKRLLEFNATARLERLVPWPVTSK